MGGAPSTRAPHPITELVSRAPAPPTRSRPQAVLDWEEKEHERQQALSSVAARGGGAGGDGDEPRFIAYVPLPDLQAIEAKVLEMKRHDLLSKYTSEALLQQQAQAKSLLNKN